MQSEVAVTELIEIPCRQDEALAIIRDIQTIERTEVKVDTVQVIPQTEHTGTYKARGSFAGVRWRNEFAYVLHDMGFHSVEAYPPPSGVRIKGGFVVVATGPRSCLVLHYEQYVVSGWAMLVKPFIAWYLHWSMRKELRDVSTLVLARSSGAVTAH
jgi:hypothetical protein